LGRQPKIAHPNCFLNFSLNNLSPAIDSPNEHEEELERVEDGDKDHDVVEGGRGKLERLDVEGHPEELDFGRLLKRQRNGLLDIILRQLPFVITFS
jgi:hypothetical protein